MDHRRERTAHGVFADDAVGPHLVNNRNRLFDV
jgi:hypothetical protein